LVSVRDGDTAGPASWRLGLKIPSALTRFSLWDPRFVVFVGTGPEPGASIDTSRKLKH